MSEPETEFWEQRVLWRTFLLWLAGLLIVLGAAGGWWFAIERIQTW